MAEQLTMAGAVRRSQRVTAEATSLRLTDGPRNSRESMQLQQGEAQNLLGRMIRITDRYTRLDGAP